MSDFSDTEGTGCPLACGMSQGLWNRGRSATCAQALGLCGGSCFNLVLGQPWVILVVDDLLQSLLASSPGSPPVGLTLLLVVLCPPGTTFLLLGSLSRKERTGSGQTGGASKNQQDWAKGCG